MKHIRRADLTPTLWKNGGGLTWEIAGFPKGAGPDGFLWRLSMAEVASDGPFSTFPDIDRILMVMSGQGLHLDFAQGGSVLLDGASPPFAFPGEAAVNARLKAGRIIDLNIMVRRGYFRVHCCLLAQGSPLPAQTMAIVAQNGPVSLAGHHLAVGELLLADCKEDLTGYKVNEPAIAIVPERLRQ